jgi:formate dehydrogenase subunit delta
MPDHHGLQKLIYMANQIGAFFKAQDANAAPAKIAEHLSKFWEARLRRTILAHLHSGGAGLDPTVRQGVKLLQTAYNRDGLADLPTESLPQTEFKLVGNS